MDLEKMLKKWQSRLGLSDWNITIKFDTARNMNDNLGSTYLQNQVQMADIRIKALNDRQKSDSAENDPELDLVHELIHIRLWAIDPRDAEGVFHICREQAIEWIAKALITSDRQT